MAYHTRNLLHYFRLLPNQRFLFGMRGGLFATNRSRQMIKKEIRRNFRSIFPAWYNVYIEHEWYGLLCLNRSRTPDFSYPKTMRIDPKRLPLGSYRRHLLRPPYQWMVWQDRQAILSI